MPIVFIHGVAVRDEDDPQFALVERLTRGTEWPVIEGFLREHVAPVLAPAAPQDVAVLRVYWGDLGMPLAPDGAQPAVTLHDSPMLAALTPEELGRAVERELFEDLPPTRWPAVVRAVWSTVAESSTKAQLAARSPARQGRWLEKEVRSRLRDEAPELFHGLGTIGADLSAQGRRGIRRAMAEVRRPFADFVPIFVGDVLRYVDGRGLPGAPGPVIRRVLDVLGEAGAMAADTDPTEPLVVLTHSMGGQLLYDTLTAFSADLPAGVPRVDFWCCSGGQIGLFAQLGVFLEATLPEVAGLDATRVGYLWNAWSSSDILSFPAEGIVPGAVDCDFAFPGSVASTHLAYLHDIDFYRTLAAKVAVQCR